jgi:hypothetical protein
MDLDYLTKATKVMQIHNITTAKLTNTTQTNSLLQTEEEKNLGKILIGNARRMTNLCLWD